MALIAWYPLHEDLKDWSGNNNHLSYVNNSGKLSSSTSGKIGNCYQRTQLNTTDLYRSAEKVSLGKGFTISAWVFPTGGYHSGTANGLVTNHNHGTNTGAGLTLKHVSSTDVRLSCNTGTGSNRTYHTYFGTSNIHNKWAHCVMHNDGNTLSLWVNGVMERSVIYHQRNVEDFIELFSWSTGNSNSASYRPTCRLNDVRLYDHALSVKDIKELAKAKILHYNFNEPRGGSIINKNITWSIHSYSSLISRSDTHWEVTQVHTNKYIAINHGTTYPAGTRIRISGYMTINGKPTAITGTSTYGVTESYKNDPKTGWFSIIERYNNASSWTFHQSWNQNVGDIIRCSDIRVENLTTDSNNNEVVEDITGLGNDAILDKQIPTHVINSTSSMGSGHYNYNATNIWNNERYKISSSLNHTSRQISLSIWAKHGNLGSMRSPLFKYDDGVYSAQGGNGAILLCIESNKLRMHGWGSGDPTVTTDTSDNKWHHFGYTYNYDTHVMKLYVDGELETTFTDSERNLSPNITNYKWHVGGNPRGYSPTTQNTFVGDIDDPRIYATILSDDDMKSLYEVKASVDKYGGLHANELVESETIIALPNITAICDYQQYGQVWYSSSMQNIASSIDYTRMVESDKTLGNIYLTGWVHITNTAHIPTTFEYTRANNDMGFYMYFNDKTDWKVGWNYVHLTRVVYTNVANTDWSNMNRLEIYGSGLSGSPTGNDTITFRDIKIHKRSDNSTSSSVKKTGIANYTEFNELSLIRPSKVDYSTWNIGSTSATGWSRNGSSTENIIGVETNPWGDQDVMWSGKNTDAGSDADAGYNGSTVSLDPNMHHRYSQWIRREVTGNGSWYFGCNGSYTEHLSGSANTNPYFKASGSVYGNEWFLVVAYLYKTGTTDTNTYTDHGVYDVRGNKIDSVSNFRMKTGSSINSLRSYLYYSTDANTVQHFYRPRIDPMDGHQPSFEDLLSGATHTPIISQYNTSGRFEDNTARIKKDGSFNGTGFNEV